MASWPESEGIVVPNHIKDWISSVVGLTGVIGVTIVPLVTKRIGIKITYLASYFIMAIALLLYIFSKSGEMILTAQVIHCLVAMGCSCTINLMIITEYTDPKYRGLFMGIKTGSLLCGFWVANALGTYFWWRTIPILALICTGYIFLIFIWPESPYYLALNGRHDECKNNFRWLRGTDAKAEAELSELIENVNQRTSVQSESETRRTARKTIIVDSEFYKPLLIAVSTSCLYNFTGKWACNIFVLEILMKITNVKELAYKYMLILDGVTVLSTYIGSYLLRILNRRTALLGFSSLGCACSLLVSIYLFLLKASLVEEQNGLCLILLTIMAISLSCGPLIVSFTVISEITPQKYKTPFASFIGVFHFTLLTIVLKFNAFLIRNYGIYIIFLLFSLSGVILIVVLYKYLPETKDKTLIEVEKYFKNKHEVQGDESKVLMH